MPIDQSPEQLNSLLRELCRLTKETEWVEFKHNNDDAPTIGEYISGLAILLRSWVSSRVM